MMLTLQVRMYEGPSLGSSKQAEAFSYFIPPGDGC